MAWVGELGDNELAVVFEGGVAVVELLKAVAMDRDEFLVIACTAVGRIVVGRLSVVVGPGIPPLVVHVYIMRFIRSGEELACPLV